MTKPNFISNNLLTALAGKGTFGNGYKTGWIPDNGESRAFLVKVEFPEVENDIDDAAQGLKAVAHLFWEVHSKPATP